jgi:hypothetical protein
MEDRFLCFDLMLLVSVELEAAGFKHVISSHHIDPKWRESYRPNRPELEPIAWTIRISTYLLPMQEMKALIKICERHSLKIWWDARLGIAEDGGSELFLKLGTNDRAASAYITPRE